MQVSIRRLQSHEDYAKCVALQKATWGEHFQECVPPAILMVSQKIGGVTAGAFDAQGNLIGFVFGLTGIKDGQPVHWSHMLAVSKEAQGQGLGYRLKLFQRQLLLETGVKIVYWTYDPLVARNAHLNLNKLGAKVEEYVEEMYGDDTGSDLHRGIGMDRFIVAWHIDDESVRNRLAGVYPAPPSDWKSIPVVNSSEVRNGLPAPMQLELYEASRIRVEIPPDISLIQKTSLETAAQWRESTRKAFLHYQAKGYRVTHFVRDQQQNRYFYILNCNVET